MGVVLRLRGAAEGFEPGFALPLLLTLEGAMAGVLVCGATECWGMRGRRAARRGVQPQSAGAAACRRCGDQVRVLGVGCWRRLWVWMREGW
tara:strand:+ start:33998 stop:34270 length:273 start_codon:yes stop_codon:yes gene_type:complete